MQHVSAERCAERVESLFIVVISLITGGCELSAGRKICRQDEGGCYSQAPGQCGTLVDFRVK